MGIFKDENGRSYGDWTHRGSGRTHEHANNIVHDSNEKKWYDQTFWIIFFLAMLWPVGLVLMWRSTCTWHIAFKIIATILVIAVVYVAICMSQAVYQATGVIS